MTTEIPNGVIRIEELNSKDKVPRLTIFIEGELGRVINGCHEDQATHDFPAQSFAIMGKQVDILYDFLKSYYGD